MTRDEYEGKAREQYRDVIDLLREQVTVNSDIEHTGGGCLAIRVWLGSDWYALVTANEDVLPSDRPHGWSVGLYSCADDMGFHRLGCEGFTLYESTDPDPVKMVDEVAPLLERVASGEPCRAGRTLREMSDDEARVVDTVLAGLRAKRD